MPGHQGLLRLVALVSARLSWLYEGMSMTLVEFWGVGGGEVEHGPASAACKLLMRNLSISSCTLLLTRCIGDSSGAAVGAVAILCGGWEALSPAGPRLLSLGPKSVACTHSCACVPTALRHVHNPPGLEGQGSLIQGGLNRCEGQHLLVGGHTGAAQHQHGRMMIHTVMHVALHLCWA